MGTLSRELRQCAADTEVTCTVDTAAHVLHTRLDVRCRVNQFGAGRPGQYLVTDGLLKVKNRVLESKLFSAENNTKYF